MKRLEKILCELHPNAEIKRETGLITDGVLDSLDIVTLVTDINDAYKINIGAEDISRENFDSIESICALIRRCGGEICS